MEGYDKMAEEIITNPEGGAGATNPEVAGQTTPPNEGQGQQQTTPSAEELKQFTQAQIDEMIQKAKGQVSKKFADYDELKGKIKEFEDAAKQKELEEMGELDRLKAQLADKEEAFGRLAKEATLTKLETAFEKAAKKFDIPEKYIADAKLLAGINEGTVLETIEETVKALVEAKPFLVEKKEVQQKEIGGANNPSGNKAPEKAGEQLLKEAADKARKTGRVEDKIAYVALKRELGL
jgi:hypothetical protein